MRIGVFSDTHGNYGALQAIYQLFVQHNCDEIIHCGDMITMGPQSKECLDFFFSHPITLIRGNHDNNYVNNFTAQKGESHVTSQHKQFVFESIGDAYRAAVARLPLQIYRSVGSYTVAFMHYAPSPNPQFTFTPIRPQPSAAIFDEIFATIEAQAVFFGHKHEPCQFTGERLYVDIGSVGCHEQSCAKGIIIELQKDGLTFNRVSAPYDRAAMYQIMKNINLPDAKNVYDYYFKEALNV